MGTVVLCQWDHVLLISLSVLYCQLPALPADTPLQWWPVILSCLLGHPGTRAHHLSSFLTTVLQTDPSTTPVTPALSLFLFFPHSVFIWDLFLPVTSSLLCWNDLFSFLSSLFFFGNIFLLLLRFPFQPSSSHESSAASFLALLHTLLHLFFHPIIYTWQPSPLCWFPWIFRTRQWGEVKSPKTCNNCTWVQMPLQVCCLNGQVIQSIPFLLWIVIWTLQQKLMKKSKNSLLCIGNHCSRTAMALLDPSPATKKIYVSPL